jgi:hypothetical protein
LGEKLTLQSFFKKHFQKQQKAPVVLISKETDIKEFSSVEEAMIDIENDSNIPKEKIEKLRSSVEALKNKGIIKIQNGEIIE